MEIAFFGSPEMAADTLHELLSHSDHKVTLIVTQPDKPSGKHLTPTPTALKQYALQHNIPYFDHNISEKPHLDELIHTIKMTQLQLGVLFAYNNILPKQLLDAFPKGLWNIHPSLLPLYRGASPTVAPLLTGDEKTGVCIIQMEEKLDAGDILGMTTVLLDEKIRRDGLEKILSKKGSALLIDLLNNPETITPISQDHSRATFTSKIRRQDGYISALFLQDALSGQKTKEEHMPELMKRYINMQEVSRHDAALLVYRMYRALHPWPGIWTEIHHQQHTLRLKILACTLKNDGKLLIEHVQLEGKKPVPFSTFLSAYKMV